MSVHTLNLKTTFNNFYDAILLFGGHIDIGRQAKTALENIRSNVGYFACNIGVGACSTTSTPRYKGAHAE